MKLLPYSLLLCALLTGCISGMDQAAKCRSDSMASGSCVLHKRALQSVEAFEQAELLGTWIMGASDGIVYGTFRPDHVYIITHGTRLHAHGTWSLSEDGTNLKMTNGESGESGTTTIHRFDGRLLQITTSNGHEGSWRKYKRLRGSTP